MLDLSNINYKASEDFSFFLEAEGTTIDNLAEVMRISKQTIYKILNGRVVDTEVYERLYSCIYDSGYRLNKVKEEFLKEKGCNILFHGSKNGLSKISVGQSRPDCDFGRGFYLGEKYDNALSFVCDGAKASVYSFEYKPENLKVKTFKCSMEWMLAICHYRGTLKEFEESPLIKGIVDEVEKSDVVVAPIADNRMFYIMTQFAKGDINSDIALHSLSASSLGSQIVIRTEKALSQLTPIEKYYLCESEKTDSLQSLNKRADEIETKLKMAKRDFRNGMFIEELLNERV